ncbi:preprotein translocase subunit SecG [Candidatus Gottesmanbacteria bacterium]|nr:preprotein translocase subunit SecG [Candidatus Gottesmanbacteria bacterium]
MKNLFVILQIIIAMLLVGAILLQARGQGLSASFGGGGEFYRSKRGLEKLLFWATVVLVCLFAITSVLNLVL